MPQLKPDQAGFQALLDENAALTRQLATVQRRATRLVVTQARRVANQQAELLRLRAELIAKDTALAWARQDMQALEAATPGLKSRQALTQHLPHMTQRLQQTQRELMHAQQQRRWQNSTPPSHPSSILCIGGRQTFIPIHPSDHQEQHRPAILHHDGDLMDNPQGLDNNLAEADLVICQTGCLSHDAYWRVKTHCKRTGKLCVFIDAHKLRT